MVVINPDTVRLLIQNKTLVFKKTQLFDAKIFGMLAEDNFIQFDENGGKLEIKSEVISGRNIYGEDIKESLNNCKYILINVTTISKDSLIINPDIKIQDIVTADNKLISFQEPGGIYKDISEEIIYGIDHKGNLLIENPKALTQLGIDKVDWLTTLIVYVSSVAVIGLLLALITHDSIRGSGGFLPQKL